MAQCSILDTVCQAKGGGSHGIGNVAYTMNKWSSVEQTGMDKWMNLGLWRPKGLVLGGCAVGLPRTFSHSGRHQGHWLSSAHLSPDNSSLEQDSSPLKLCLKGTSPSNLANSRPRARSAKMILTVSCPKAQTSNLQSAWWVSIRAQGQE